MKRKQTIYHITLPDNSIVELGRMQITDSYIKSHYPDLYEQVIKMKPEYFQEKLYWQQHHLTDYPKCPICGSVPVFEKYNTGYRTYCSAKCSNSCKEKQAKTIRTNIERYGVAAPVLNKDIQAKINKTNRERYGADWTFQSEIVRDKSKQTCRKHYGCDWASANPEVKARQIQTQRKKYGGCGFESVELRNKTKQTCLNQYGNEYYSNTEQSVRTQREWYGGVGCESPILKEKYLSTRRNNITQQKDFLLGYTNEGDWICACPHPKCNKCTEKYYIISCNRYCGRIKNNTEPCTRLLPVQKSHSANTTIELFVQSILDEVGVEYETNKFILNGQQVDIWIPSMNFAIECNGVYHHSLKFKTPSYHINKFKTARDLGIRLLTIWWDQYINHPDIVKSMILTKLGYNNQTIYARKCEVREVSSEDCGDFLEENHIQGNTPTKVRLGLYNNNELVSIMTFVKFAGCQGNKQVVDGTWNLNRFCNKRMYRVIGGAGKLLKHFIRTYQPTSIISHSHNDISDGHLYKTLGFETDGKINTSYYYIKGNKRWHRSTFTKAGIVRRGWKDNVDSSWTEREVMEEHKYLCIYDSGTVKWTLNCNKKEEPS